MVRLRHLNLIGLKLIQTDPWLGSAMFGTQALINNTLDLYFYYICPSVSTDQYNADDARIILPFLERRCPQRRKVFSSACGVKFAHRHDPCSSSSLRQPATPLLPLG